MLHHRENSLVAKLDAHDRYQLEVKLEYPSDTDERSNRYETVIHFFLPENLNADRATYPPAKFYEDVHNYIRFKTPQITLRQLLDPNNPNSPLNELTRLLESWSGEDSTRRYDRIEYELRMFGCMLRAAFREGVRFLDDALDRPGELNQKEALRFAYRAVTTGGHVIEQYRQHGEAFVTPAVPDSLRAAFQLVDEFCSLVTEAFGQQVLAVLAQHRLPATLEEQRTDLEAQAKSLLAAEVEYRRARGFPSLADPDVDNEEYVFRKGLLKRYVYTDLFLRVKRQDQGARWQHILFGIAAGLSMAFATAVTFWATIEFAQVSWGFFFALVIGYVFKDRLKDGFKAAFAKLLKGKLPDRTMNLIDPAPNITVGTCYQKARYVRRREAPPEVIQLRNLKRTEYNAERRFREAILQFTNGIRLLPDRIERVRDRVSAVTHIFRFNVRHLLYYMDEPTTQLELFDFETGDLSVVDASKTYHVNLIISVPEHGGGALMSKVRLVLDRNGIKRVEQLDAEHGVWQRDSNGTPHAKAVEPSQGALVVPLRANDAIGGEELERVVHGADSTDQ